ncbi:MAG: hypothetical protein R3B82_00885 [Sandaracinaceae bacterium]
MIEVLPFERGPFGMDFPDGGTPQTEYLWNYLEKIGCESFIRESEYVDRHYLDDFTSYHARTFRTPEVRCQRLHFFAASPDVVGGLIDEAYGTDLLGRQQVEAKLEKLYRGFVVVRPVRRAHIGRAVLATYPPDGGRRQYTAVRRYVVHVGALRLTIDGLAFQQQDGGAAVCASTALWSALQKVAHLAGHRTPTPSRVTAASQTPYAASYGLDESQMAMALSQLGYAADVFAPGESRAAFRAKLAASLRSHLPVVLMVGDENDGHAVTVTGYSEPSEEVEVPVRGARQGLMRWEPRRDLRPRRQPRFHARELLDDVPSDLEDEGATRTAARPTRSGSSGVGR